MEELGMFIENIYLGEPLHMAVKDIIPGPYELLPSGRILHCPPAPDKRQLLFFRVLSIDGCSDDIDALNEKIAGYRKDIMAEDHDDVSFWMPRTRRSAGMRLEMKLRIVPLLFGSLSEETRKLLFDSWSEEFNHPLAKARVPARWYLNKL